MDRVVLEAVAELAVRGAVRENWSDAARAQALEARRKKAHGILSGYGKITMRGPALDFTPHPAPGPGSPPGPWTIAPSGTGGFHVTNPKGEHHSSHATPEDAASALRSIVQADRLGRRMQAAGAASKRKRRSGPLRRGLL